MNKFFERKWARLLFWTIFPLATFFILGKGISVALKFVMILTYGIEKSSLFFRDTTFLFMMNLAIAAVISSVMYFVPTKIFKMKISRSDLGFGKDMTWSDIGLGVAGLVVSMILAGIVLSIIGSIFPDFDVEQKQELGFSVLNLPHEFVLAFFAIAVLPAIYEEFVFRGVIYGELRKINILAATLIASLLFGVAHVQINVAIVTFVMSVVMCYIREKITDTIWAGIVLHFLKNALAFFIIFMLPKIQMM